MIVGHDHFDSNSFIINMDGSWVAADAGYEDYFNTPRHLFTTGSIGHNTLLVDESIAADGSDFTGGQDVLAGGTLDGLFDGAGYAAVRGHAAATYATGLLDHFDRDVLYAKPDVVFVLDDVAAPAAHAFSFLLHAGPTGSLNLLGGGRALSAQRCPARGVRVRHGAVVVSHRAVPGR